VPPKIAGIAERNQKARVRTLRTIVHAHPEMVIFVDFGVGRKYLISGEALVRLRMFAAHCLILADQDNQQPEGIDQI
jgi:hypothetical protein